MDIFFENKLLNIIGLLVFILLIPSCRLDQVMEIVRQENYPIEKHTVQTEDGYILTLHRIPRAQTQEKDRKIILLMHGLSDSSQAFLCHSRQKPTAFELFDSNFDVWMLNARGNTFSQQHIKLNASDAQFWDFSWHEIGVYDIPATIDYILNETNNTKLAYVGVSQGVTVLFVTLSERPEYNDKISIGLAMAAVVTLKYNYAPFLRSVEFINDLGEMLRKGGVNDLTPPSMAKTVQSIAPICSTSFGSELCRSFMFTFFGPSVQYFDRMLFNITDHYQAGSSYKQFIHYGQNIATGKFQKYYHNKTKNVELYGSSQPPEYDLSKMTARIHFLYGTNDRIAPAENIPLIIKKMVSSPVGISKFPGYNHIDFTYGRNLKMVHKKMFKVLKHYS